MAHVLTIPASPSVALPEQLEWTDEFGWQAVVQSTAYSLDGALVVETAAKQAGRPITLAGAEDRGWLDRANVELLRAAAARPGLVMALALDDGRTFDVMFRHDEGAIDARLVVYLAPIEITDPYVVTVRLMEV